MKPVLQNRWIIKGKTLVYYGLRAKLNTFKNEIKISNRVADFIHQLDGEHLLNEYPYYNSKQINKLIEQQIIVDVSEKKGLPSSIEEATFCTKCCANDFTIPGLELDSDGLCPICTTYPSIKKLKSPLPIMNVIPSTPKARFDVALLYSGGKDSTYMLYYLSKVLGLRVLALTWKQPYMSESALTSIENAKKCLPNVTFVIREASPFALKKIYKKSFELQGNTCICPSIAYILFYPLLLDNYVPYLVLGNEPAQAKAMIFNHLAPKFLYRPFIKNFMRFFMNIGRVLTFRKPFSKGQLEMFLTVKNIAFGKSRLLKFFHYENEVTKNLYTSLSAAKEVLIPLQYAVSKSRSGKNVPALVHIDFDALTEAGAYDWNHIKRLLKKEIGWIEPHQSLKGLHTSCNIERCKDFSQLENFKSMRSRIIPFSALELSLAVLSGSVTREGAIKEITKCSGFCASIPDESKLMMDFFNQQ